MRKALIIAALLGCALAISQQPQALIPVAALPCPVMDTPMLGIVLQLPGEPLQFSCAVMEGFSLDAGNGYPAVLHPPKPSFPRFADAKQPRGLVDGRNASFLLDDVPIVGSVILTLTPLKGATRILVLGWDYNVERDLITFATLVPQQDDFLRASYRY